MMARATKIPTSVAATKAKTSRRPVPIAGKAPPGQKPAIPQPTPNKAEPPKRRASNLVAVGRENLPSKIGPEGRGRTKRYPIKVTSKAPPITKARLGSQLPATSKKLITFAGLDMPDREMPRPKIRPMIYVEI